jgi:hypothetical protein
MLSEYMAPDDPEWDDDPSPTLQELDHKLTAVTQSANARIARLESALAESRAENELLREAAEKLTGQVRQILPSIGMGLVISIEAGRKVEAKVEAVESLLLTTLPEAGNQLLRIRDAALAYVKAKSDAEWLVKREREGCDIPWQEFQHADDARDAAYADLCAAIQEGDTKWVMDQRE